MIDKSHVDILKVALDGLRAIKSDIEGVLETEDAESDNSLDYEQCIENEEAGLCMEEAVDDINGAISSIEWILG